MQGPSARSNNAVPIAQIAAGRIVAYSNVRADPEICLWANWLFAKMIIGALRHLRISTESVERSMRLWEERSYGKSK
jgi:hypothetical protein